MKGEAGRWGGMLGNAGCDTAVMATSTRSSWPKFPKPHLPCTEELQGKGETCFFVGMKSGKFLNILVDELTSMHIQAAITGLLTYKKKKNRKKGWEASRGALGGIQGG